MTVSDDLNKAADYIETHGWNQGSLIGHVARLKGNPYPNVCALGGLRYVTDNLAYCHQLGNVVRYNKACFALEEFLGIDDIPGWNDSGERTKDEVIQALRDAAIKNQPDAMHVAD